MPAKKSTAIKYTPRAPKAGDTLVNLPLYMAACTDHTGGTGRYSVALANLSIGTRTVKDKDGAQTEHIYIVGCDGQRAVRLTSLVSGDGDSIAEKLSRASDSIAEKLSRAVPGTIVPKESVALAIKASPDGPLGEMLSRAVPSGPDIQYPNISAAIPGECPCFTAGKETLRHLCEQAYRIANATEVPDIFGDETPDSGSMYAVLELGDLASGKIHLSARLPGLRSGDSEPDTGEGGMKIDCEPVEIIPETDAPKATRIGFNPRFLGDTLSAALDLTCNGGTATVSVISEVGALVIRGTVDDLAAELLLMPMRISG